MSFYQDKIVQIAKLRADEWCGVLVCARFLQAGGSEREIKKKT